MNLKKCFKPGLLIPPVITAFLLLFNACSTLALKSADFSWPVESVLKIDQDGFVKEERHNIIFDTRELFLAETEDSSAYIDKELRMIRDVKGYVYMTSENFRNVYVFEAHDGEFCLDNKIKVSETGISSPVFNQRMPYIELVAGDKKHLINNEGIKENDNEE